MEGQMKVGDVLTHKWHGGMHLIMAETKWSYQVILGKPLRDTYSDGYKMGRPCSKAWIWSEFKKIDLGAICK
tara:strand:+ start:2532 stop:2747 length:216 start_codon:yes stop_codon:yes gene_type:complete